MPVMVTDVPISPEVGERLVIEGAGMTVNDTPLLACPLTVATTLPVVPPVGTGTTIEAALQLVGVAAEPLKVTVLVPWVDPKFVPVIVTEVPTTPEVGDRLLIDGGGTTVKETPLLACPLTVTTTLPVLAPLGTGTTIAVALQLVGVAVAPLKVTVLVPWLEPKFVPVMVTEVPTMPEAGERVVTEGGIITVNDTPLLACPLTVTTRLPVLAPLGTGTMTEVALQLVGVAVVPLNLTALVPWVDPKFVPVIVTDVPTTPEVGDRPVMEGGGITVNDTPLLTCPLTVTTTLPVLAPLGTGTTIDVPLQLVGVAAVPLKVTVLVPWLDPKFVPVIVTEVPTTPEVGDRLLIDGGGITVKDPPLLEYIPTVTRTFPVVAPTGTGTTIEVSLQFVGVAAVPLNVTVLVPWVEPKLVPVMVTDVPTMPEVGEKPVIWGGTTIVNNTPLLADPPRATTTLPVVAPLGTETPIEVSLQLPGTGVAVIPLNVTVLVPCVEPKFLPAIVTGCPIAPEAGERDVMEGGGVIVNDMLLLETPLA